MSSNTKSLGLAKLESSGLTLEDGKALGFEFLEPTQTAALHQSFKPLPSLKIPYWDPRQPTKLIQPRPSWPGFFRLRYLVEPITFDKDGKPKKTRYVQPPDSGVAAYFPRLIDWTTILNDPTYTINITEGELKAAKAAKEGFPTIGLGGVYNFRAARAGIAFLPELEKINWVKRRVNIVFDSDLKTNKNVAEALNILAEELYLRGATPYFYVLPELIENGKTGLDDFLIAEPADKLEAMLEDHSDPLTLARPLWELNRQFVFVLNPGLIVATDTNHRMSSTAFKDAYGNNYHAEQLLKPDGSISLKRVSTAKAWLEWPLRDTVGQITYAPGRPARVEHENVKRTAYNIWPGWGCSPKKGNVKPFIDLCRHLFRGTPSEDLQWFLRWCAYPIQYPGTKLTSSVVFYGARHGTGKSLVGYTLGRIYGRNFTDIKQADLVGTFNEWANGRQFVLADDVTGTNNRQDADVIKKLISQENIWINTKNVPQYAIPDCINYLFTTNQPDAFFLEDDDRRFFIHEVRVEPLPEEFYVDYGLWLDGGGASHVFHYLLNYDLGDFQPHAHARRTAAKDRMTADTRSDLGSWVRQLLDSPDVVLRLGEAKIPGDLFTNSQLLELYDPTDKRRVTANGLGRELKRAGAFQVLDGALIRGPNGIADRYYVIRNQSEWLTTTAEKVQQHLAGEAPKTRRRKF